MKENLRKQLEQRDGEAGLENKKGIPVVSGPEKDKLLVNLNVLSGVFREDKAISSKVIREVTRVLDGMKVDFFGYEMTLEEANKTLAEQQDIFKDIRNGKHERHSELIYLPADIAEILVRPRQHLDLPKLKVVTGDAAQQLAKCKQMLSLGGLVSMSPELAEALLDFRGGLLVLGMEHISSESARDLAKIKSSHYRPGITMNNLKTLDVDAARELVGDDWGRVRLEGLTHVSEEVYKILNGSVYLGLVYLPESLKIID